MGAGRRLAVQQAAQGTRAKRRGRSGRREEDGLPLCLLCVLSLSLPLVVSELPLLAELLLLSVVDVSMMTQPQLLSNYADWDAFMKARPPFKDAQLRKTSGAASRTTSSPPTALN